MHVCVYVSCEIDMHSCPVHALAMPPWPCHLSTATSMWVLACAVDRLRASARMRACRVGHILQKLVVKPELRFFDGPPNEHCSFRGLLRTFAMALIVQLESSPAGGHSLVAVISLFAILLL